MNFFTNIFNKLFLWESSEPSQSNLNSIRLNKLNLSFPKELELAFLKNYYKSSLLQINIASVAGALLFSLFFILDFFLVKKLFIDFFFFRIVFVWLIIGWVLWTINAAENKNVSQFLLSIAIILISAINIMFIVLAYPKLNNYYYVGLLLINFWSYSFLKLRFVWATFAGLTVFLMYLLTTLFIIKLDAVLFYISVSYLLSSNLAGMGIAYGLEYFSRWNYVQNLRLKRSNDENENLHGKLNQNSEEISIVEEKLMLQSKALESAANSIIMLDKDGVIIWCNKAFTELTGYNINELIGETPRLFKSGKHDELFYKNIWTTILNGRVWSGEIINKKKNGDLYYEEMIITPVLNHESEKATHFIAVKQDITLRKDMENELFASERRLRGLFENATLGIYRSTRSGKILMANNAFIKMLGFNSLEEIMKCDFTNQGYKDPNRRKLFLNKIYETGSIVGFVSEWQKEDGTIIFIKESARIDTDENGETIFEGTVEDITLSKLAEFDLKNSKERLQTVIDNVYDAIFIHDGNGQIVDLNNKVLDLYNIGRDEVLNLNIKDLLQQELDIDTLKKYWKNVIDYGKTYKFEWKSKRPYDNFIFDIEIFFSRITLGNTNYILVNLRDITDQKEANRKLLLTQRAVDLDTTPIFWITNKAKIIYVNIAATKMLGYSSEELLRMSIFDIDPNWDLEYFNTVGYPLLKEKGSNQFESIHRKKNGDIIPIEVYSALIHYENEEVIITSVVNISERKKAAQSIIEAKERAEQSDRLKSEFLAGMSHEIRTPINTILNFASLIKTDLGNEISEDIKFSFEMIDGGSRRLIRTIDSILNMSQLQTGSYEHKVKVISLVEKVLKPLREEFKFVAQQKNLKLNLFVNAEDTHVLVDEYTITQLFINLIDNATKYTEKGEINIVVNSCNKKLIVEIIDTGIGISEEVLPTVFEPFIQEEMGYTRSFEGNGLGLALVRKYIELNKGSITVKSQKGHGSTFTVSLNKPT